MSAEIRPLGADDAAAYHALRLRALREHPTTFAQSYEEQLAMPLSAVADRLRAAWNRLTTSRWVCSSAAR